MHKADPEDQLELHMLERLEGKRARFPRLNTYILLEITTITCRARCLTN